MPTVDDDKTRLDIRPTIGLVRRLDAFIKRRPGNPSRAEVARSILEEALERDERVATKRGAQRT